jgi:hypothetical protein
MVVSSAVPIEAPTCWAVLTVAEATPASRWSTPLRSHPTRRPSAAQGPAPDSRRARPPGRSGLVIVPAEMLLGLGIGTLFGSTVSVATQPERGQRDGAEGHVHAPAFR